jgi:hypothetical protein
MPIGGYVHDDTLIPWLKIWIDPSKKTGHSLRRETEDPGDNKVS